jgi:hypothetical protein
MVYITRDYWFIGHHPSSGILENKTFRKLDLFPSSGEWWERPSLLGSLYSGSYTDADCPVIEG